MRKSCMRNQLAVAAQQADLQVLGGLGQAQRVEAAVAWEAAVQPRRPGGVGQPQALVCSSRWLIVSCWVRNVVVLQAEQAVRRSDSLVAPLPPLRPAGLRLGTGAFTDFLSCFTCAGDRTTHRVSR